MTDSGQRRLDPQTVAGVHSEFAGELRRFLIGLLRNAELAEEALQNTFGQTLRTGGPVDTTAWRPWLFRVAYNEAMALRRRQHIDAKALQEIARTAPRFGLGAQEGLIEAEQLDRLQAAIDRLPVDQRTVVLRRINSEQTFQQIADDLSIPLGTVLTRMRLALVKLRAALHDTAE